MERSSEVDEAAIFGKVGLAVDIRLLLAERASLFHRLHCLFAVFPVAILV